MTKIYLSIFLFFPIFISSCDKEVLLTKHKWEIVNVEDVSGEYDEPFELYRGTIWNFNSDKTVYFKMDNEYHSKLVKGNWDIRDNEVTLYMNNDTTKVIIEKITNSKLIWVMDYPANQKMRFYHKKHK